MHRFPVLEAGHYRDVPRNEGEQKRNATQDTTSPFVHPVTTAQFTLHHQTPALQVRRSDVGIFTHVGLSKETEAELRRQIHAIPQSQVAARVPLMSIMALVFNPSRLILAGRSCKITTTTTIHAHKLTLSRGHRWWLWFLS